MTWNYRVMRHEGTPNDDPYFAIHEVFYGENGEKPGWTADPIDVSGADPAELRQTLEWMMLALDKSVLDYETGEEIAPLVAN